MLKHLSLPVVVVEEEEGAGLEGQEGLELEEASRLPSEAAAHLS